MRIPTATSAKVLFLSDRTCCVCREGGRPVQIHHLDEDNFNDRIENLAVLCLECHALTQLQGGFHRRLDAEQVRLYRSDWYDRLAAQRANEKDEGARKHPPMDAELIAGIADRLRDNGQWELLARLFDTAGHPELRNKYIVRALEQPGMAFSSRVFWRVMLDKNSVSAGEIRQAVEQLLGDAEYATVARLLHALGCAAEALRAYCIGIQQKLAHGETFHAASLARELADRGLSARLFEAEYLRHKSRDDLWWQTRCLQEMGDEEQLKALIFSRKAEIENGSDELLKLELYRALGDWRRFREKAKLIFGEACQVAANVTRLGGLGI